MSLPMKGLTKVGTKLNELKQTFKTFSRRCDYNKPKKVGQHHNVACCHHEGYDSNEHPSLLCMFDCCPVVHGSDKPQCICEVTGYNKYCTIHGELP